MCLFLLDKFAQASPVTLLTHDILPLCSQVCLVLATCKAADITTEQIGSTDRLSNPQWHFSSCAAHQLCRCPRRGRSHHQRHAFSLDAILLSSRFWWLHACVRPYPKKTPETLEKVGDFGCLLRFVLTFLGLRSCLAWFIRLAGCQKILCQVAVCSNCTRCFSGHQELELAVAMLSTAISLHKPHRG